MRAFKNEDEIKETGWDNSDYVNYGIASKKDKDKVFFLNPGTAVRMIMKGVLFGVYVCCRYGV